ncbi:MAG TPA: quinoprotein relay system zinc metallohydrolase 2 [Alphaproteobacteria bacterium]|nr:quinoprotein relay system zinc metallohydrolase 2 [Alphaproteobacteria bacterium]
MQPRHFTGLIVALFLTSLDNASGAPPPLPVTEVASGIFVRQGVQEDATPTNNDMIANIGFIVGADAVAVIDPGGSRIDGERLRAAVLATTNRPIRYVIMSHAHPDHVFGAAAFAPDHPTYVGHARMPGALADRGEYDRRRLAEILGVKGTGDFVVPTLLVEKELKLDLGGRVLDLSAHAAAHTDSDLTIFDRSTGTLWAADLLFVDRIPVIDGSLVGWLKVLQDLKSLPAAHAIPGHGPIFVPWPAAATDEERYFNVLLRETRALLARGGNIETAIATVGQSERDKWLLFDEYNGRNVIAAFKELEWE